MTTIEKQEIVKTEAELLMNSPCINALVNLYERYQDEKEYEPWELYVREVIAIFDMYEVVKVTKRPFSVHLNIEDIILQVGVKVASRSRLEVYYKAKL